MNKSTPYIILFFVAAAVAVLLLTGNNKREKKFNEQVTLRQRDKIPYGTHIAFQHLSYMFPNASISIDKHEPGYWDSLSNYRDEQALIIVSPYLRADEYEMKKLIRFMENGNDVFISTRTLSPAAENILNVNSVEGREVEYDSEGKKMERPLAVELTDPPFGPEKKYTYDGVKFSSWFIDYDSSTTDVLGIDDQGNPNFIHFRAGKGNLYLHLAPITLSNYFLLQKENIHYYEKIMSVISPGTKKVVWDEYYLNKRYYYDSKEEEKQSWVSVLFRYKGLKWALLVAIFTLALYVLMEMRRKQRYIPVVSRPRNDSLDFVKTIGRLYYDRGDHLNLCRKMASYFLEYVRNQYKIATGVLDEEFIRKLQFKSGVEEIDIREIVTFIRDLKGHIRVTEKQMAAFHRKLENFYQKA